MAGGLNPFAEGGKIRIFRKQANATEIIRFDYDDVVKGKELAQNIVLKRGDVIVVP
jgi:polysaccharide export outer membrane protein